MPFRVMEHVYDEASNTYRVLIGQEVERLQPMTDQDGVVILVADGEEMVPMLETIVDVVPTEDFVFAADDPRYEDMDDEGIAASHRGQIAAAMQKRMKDMEAQAELDAKRHAMPGVGEAL